MKKLFFVRLALLNTFKKRLRAILAICSITLTSAVMIVLFGVEIGLQGIVKTEMSSSESQDVVTVSQRNVNQVRLNDAKISDIQSISGVAQVAQSVGLPAAAVYHGITLDVPSYGVTSEYFAMEPTAAVAGEIEGKPVGSTVVVSKKVLEAFGIPQNQAVGKTLALRVTINPDYSSASDGSEKKTELQQYSIVGVIDRGELPVVYLPLEYLRQNGVDSVAQLKVRASNVDKIPGIRETIEQMGLQTASILDTIERINKLFDVIHNILFIFCVVVLVVTIGGVFTIITLTLMEETRQIGFLRIVGLRRDDVRTLFIIQSIALTFFGAVGGILLGLVAGGVLNGIARHVASSESFAGNVILFAIPEQPIIMILMLSVVVGWVVGLVPAKRATLINPLKELEL